MHVLSILLWRYTSTGRWLQDLIPRCICFFTESQWVRVGVGLIDTVYESRYVYERSKGLCHAVDVHAILETVDIPDVYMIPWRLELTEERIDRILRTLGEYTERCEKCNPMLMAGVVLIWLTRRLWKRIGWVPLAKIVKGESPGKFVQGVMFNSRWDLFPEEWCDYETPKDFAGIPGWTFTLGIHW